MAIRMIDHVVVVGPDLEQLTGQFGDIGFTVTPGERHPGGSENALIPFADGSYIELLSFWQPATGSARYDLLQHGGGLSDFTLLSDDLETDLAPARERGVPYGQPTPGSRTRPDGGEIRWLEAPVEGDAREIPRLIQDLTDRELRVPGGAPREHANGIRGIARLIVVTDDLEATGRHYRILLGDDAERVGYTGETVWGSYVVGDQEVEIHQPLSEGDMADHLARLAKGPFEIVLLGLEDHPIPPESTGDARISVIAG